MNGQDKTAIPDLTVDDLKRLANQKQYGTIQHYFRLLRGWKGWELAIFYSEALASLKDEIFEDEEIKFVTANWIHSMENRNEVPVNRTKRALLAGLLGIPLAYFGFEAWEQSLLPMNMAPPSFSWEAIDIQEYRTTLEHYSTSWLSGDTLRALLDVKRRIDNLHNATYSTTTQEKEQIFSLLCEYYVVASWIVHEQRYFDLAIELLSRAILIAEEKQLYPLLAYALRCRAVAHLDKGEIQVGLLNFAAGASDFQAAATNFDAVKLLKKQVSAQRYGFISFAAGRAYARVAENQKELTDALHMIDEGGKAIKKEYDDHDDIHFFQLDEERLHLDKGIAYIASPVEALRFPAAAQRELERASALTKPTNKMRHLENAIRQAEAHFYQGIYPLAVTYCQQTLSLMRELHPSPDQHLIRLDTLHTRLRESPFGGDPDVAHFGVELLKVQRPDLFKK